jgi:hypothetical protein
MHAEALAAGADPALEKPCLPHELQATVRSFLDQDPKRQGKRARAVNFLLHRKAAAAQTGDEHAIMPEVAERTAYYMNRQLSVVALFSKGLRLPIGPWLWVADSSMAAWQVEKMLGDVFPVLKGTVLNFFTFTSEAEVKEFERSLQGQLP